jgi:hypothetical protein
LVSLDFAAIFQLAEQASLYNLKEMELHVERGVIIKLSPQKQGILKFVLKNTDL